MIGYYSYIYMILYLFSYLISIFLFLYLKIVKHQHIYVLMRTVQMYRRRTSPLHQMQVLGLNWLQVIVLNDSVFFVASWDGNCGSIGSADCQNGCMHLFYAAWDAECFLLLSERILQRRRQHQRELKQSKQRERETLCLWNVANWTWYIVNLLQTRLQIMTPMIQSELLVLVAYSITCLIHISSSY